MQGTINGEVNGKKITGEVLIKKTKEFTMKLNLPERVIQFTRELKRDGVKYTLHPNLVKDKAHEHSLSITNTRSTGRSLNEYVMNHPSFKRPLKLSIDIINQKSMKLELDVANDEKKKLTLLIYKHSEGRLMKTGLHFYREDRKIDMGAIEEKYFLSDKKQTKMQVKRVQHWVDKNGKNQTLIRTEEVLVETDDKNSMFDITAKSVFQTLKNSISLDYKVNFDLQKQIVNGIVNSIINKVNKKTEFEFEFKSHCLKIDSYELPKESYKSNHLINLCATGKASDTDLVNFEYTQQQLDAKKKLKNNEKLLVKLSRAEEQQLRMTLKWDPDMLGEWIVEVGEYIENRQKEEMETVATIQSELEDKYNLLKDSLMNDLIIPMRKHRQESFNEIVKEINPKLAAKLFRSKRAVANKNQTEMNFLNFTENLAKKLFNFKLVKFAPEEGQIVFLFRSHPSFEGIRYGILQSFEYMF